MIPVWFLHFDEKQGHFSENFGPINGFVGLGAERGFAGRSG